MQDWTWGAAGKHPIVKDYISLGQETPLLHVFSRWVEEGYHKVNKDTTHRSWRFFAKGMKRAELSCGLLRNSHDGVGRPFPFIILGSGPLEGWEPRWEILPLAFDTLWERMEYLCAKRVFDLTELKKDIERLPNPSLPEEGQFVVESGSELPQQQDGILSIPLKGTGDPREEIIQCLMLFKSSSHHIPDAVFIGGPAEQSFLVIFTRSLNMADFKKLWAVEL